MEQKTAPVGISNKHVHLTREHVEALFGKGYELTFLREIRQSDDYVAAETVDISGPKGVLEKVRVVGPCTAKTQVELSLTGARSIGVNPDIRISHDLAGSAGAVLAGPAGKVTLTEGVIAAKRHIHLHPEEVKNLGLSEGQEISVRAAGGRGLVFEHVIIRMDELYRLELHIDTDEANAAGLSKGDAVELLL